MNPESSRNRVDLAVQSEFNIFINLSTLYLWNLEDEKVLVRKAEQVVDTKEYEKFKDHLKHLHKDLFPSPKKDGNTFSPPKKDQDSNNRFADTINFFSTTQPKKKLFCRLDSTYLAKKYYTEGVQYVKQGEIHVYKVFARALDIYTFHTSKKWDLKSFRAVYKSYTNREQITAVDKKIILSNTYYVIIAPCHTVFTKRKLHLNDPKDIAEIKILFAEEENFQSTNLAGDENEGTPQAGETSMLAGPSKSKDDLRGNSMHSVDTAVAYDPENLNGSVRGTTSYESDRPSKRVKHGISLERPSLLPLPGTSASPSRNSSRNVMEMEITNESDVRNDLVSNFTRPYDSDGQSNAMNYSTAVERRSTSLREDVSVPPSPNTLRNELELIGNMQAVNGSSHDSHCRSVFAVRKSKSIESYALRPGSTFRVLQDNIMTGTFVIENDDMDPHAFEYHGDVQYIREVAKFKNGSTMETTLTVQKDLVDQLTDPSKKAEKIVVNYFFESAFRAIETAYKQFSEMRNTKMIGSCVPAIVPMSNSKFCGVVSDTYEAKP